MPAKFAFRFATPFGTMAIAWQAEKVIATRLPDSEKSLLESLRRDFGKEIVWNDDPPAFVLGLAAQIQAHLEGNAQNFPIEILNLESASPFFRKVYQLTHAIPPGKLRTYGAIAREAGSPGASRAVGQAMARNPFPLVIPCHRVVGGKNALVGFSAPGGLCTKTRLIELECGVEPTLFSPGEGLANNGTHH
jgi:methylated-DNA-[protein]-cysteine S-methyltransferase